MTGRIEARLAELGLELHTPHQPVANYLGYSVTGNLVWISGQGPTKGQEIAFAGRVGADLTLDQGREAARLTALNLIGHLRLACGGDLERVVGCRKLFGLVNSAPGFTDQPKVIDAASDLLADLFGEAGRHARAAIGTNALPFNIAVEIDAVFEIG